MARAMRHGSFLSVMRSTFSRLASHADHDDRIGVVSTAIAAVGGCFSGLRVVRRDGDCSCDKPMINSFSDRHPPSLWLP